MQKRTVGEAFMVWLSAGQRTQLHFWRDNSKHATIRS
jgi:hypothetical protein